jgi:hypothetical protein
MINVKSGLKNNQAAFYLQNRRMRGGDRCQENQMRE